MDETLKKIKSLLVGGALLFVIFGILPATAQAATLYFSPSSGSHAVGATFSVSIYVLSADQAMNAASGIVSFPTDKLEVTSLSKTGSIFTLWVQEPSFSNLGGTINFEGIVLNPGFTGSVGKIISINFRVKATGQVPLTFSSGSALANDGKGTNILANLGDAQFILGGTTPTVSETTTPSAISNALPTPQISSPTHPDPNKWYPNSNPVFKWNLPIGVTEVRLVLSKRVGTLPQVNYMPPINEKTLTEIDDGTWYLNAQFKTAQGLSRIASFKFNIDTIKPADFTITRLDNDDDTNPRPVLMFENPGDLSGIERYEMKIGDNDWFKIASENSDKPYKLPLQSPGTHEVWVKATDRAGNSTEANAEIIVKPVPIPKPIIKEFVAPKIKIGETVVVKGVVVPKVTVKIAPEIVLKVVVVVVDVLKVENNNSFGQISGLAEGANEKLIKTIDVPIDERGNFEVKIDNLESGTYILRTYGKDERGAISDAFSDTVVEVMGKSVLIQFAKWISDAISHGFNGLINLVANGWLLMILGAVGTALIYWFVKNAIPFLTGEVRKISYIAGEYKLDKKLRRHNRKTQFEVKMIYDDLQKELALFKKIEQHRGLHPEEKYFKEKLEKYLQLLKAFRRLG